MGKFWGWLAGVLGTVIGGYALWYITERPKPPTPPNPPDVTIVEGLVYTDSGPVSNARVEVTLTGVATANPLGMDFTDEHGAYRIDFSGVPPTAGALLQVSAKGYQSGDPKRLTSPLPPDTREYLAVVPMVAVSTPGQPAAPEQPAARPDPALIAKMRIPAFQPKTAERAARFRIVP